MVGTPPLGVYPGTHRPTGRPAGVGSSPPVAYWDRDPVYKVVDGGYREFFGIRALAEALGRSPKTIYKWEAKGLFPLATFVFNASSPQGQRRLYTRRQIEGVLTIARDEGVLDGRARFIGATLFPVLCADLFRATRRDLPHPIDLRSTP